MRSPPMRETRHDPHATMTLKDHIDENYRRSRKSIRCAWI